MSQCIRPKIVVESADRLLEWCRAALGAEVAERHEQEGAVVYAELTALGSTLTVKDVDATDPQTQALVLDVKLDQPGRVDEVWADMLAAGAEVVFDIDDQFYGLRGGRLRDPFGLQWILSGPLR